MEKKIIAILNEAGPKGLPPRKVARHVFNSTNSLFAPVSFDAVYKSVAYCLRRESGRAGGLFLRASFGRYVLNMDNARVKALLAGMEDPEDDNGLAGKGNIDPKNMPLSLF